MDTKRERATNAGAGKTKTRKYEYSWPVMASYGTRKLFSQWITAPFGAFVFFYYEMVIGLDSVLALTAFVIYQAWNAVNDPLTGYLMERVQFPWEKRRGYRRMPFIFAGGVLWLLSYLFIFLGPTENVDANQWAIFGWYVASLCLYDLCGTLFDVNAVSLFPEKFRGANERRTVQAFGTILGIVGLVLANVIPPLFLTTGVASTYRNSAMVTAGAGVFLFLLMIPGIYETRQLRELYRHRRENIVRGQRTAGFFRTLRVAFTNRRFVGKIVLFFGYQVSVVMLQMSALYIVTYLLDADASTMSLLMGSMLAGALISVPAWMVIAKRVNNNRLLCLIGGFLLLVTFIPMIFVQSLIGWLVSLFFFGIALGNQWFMDPPTMGDVIDDAAVRTGRRDTSVYISFQSLFYKLGQTSVAAVIGLVHVMTGFTAGAKTLAELLAQSATPSLALFGIRIHAAIVPAIVVLITTLLFWLLYDLSPERVSENKKKLEEMADARAIIIGTGISGLTAGALLAKAGHQVTLCERNGDIGGVTGGLRSNGFSWDLGQLIIEGLGPGEQAGKVIDELGLRGGLSLIPADRVYEFPDFTIKPPAQYGGAWWRKDFLTRQFPREKRGIARYYRYYRRMMEVVTLGRKADVSAGLQASLTKARMYLKLLPLLPKANWSAKRLMDHFFMGPEIKAAFTSILADFVVRPEEFQGLGVALVNPEPAFDRRVPLQVSASGRQPSYTYIDGGCRALADLLAGAIRAHGGQIRTGCEVTAIRVENGRAAGVALADGTALGADVVVASGGAKETLGGLLPPGALGEEYRRIVENVPLMESVFMVQLGLDIDPAQHLGSAVNYFYRSYDISGCIDRLVNGVYHEGEDGFLICNPTHFSPQCAPEGLYALTIYTVAPDRPAGFTWGDRKDEMAGKLLDLAQEKIPGLREHIVEMEILTPEDFRNITGQRHHSFGGCAPVMGGKPAPNRTPVEGLWFIGSQSESGAGINNAMEGAWRVCRKIAGES